MRRPATILSKWGADMSPIDVHRPIASFLGGAGSGLLYTPANIACTQYFEKWKSISTGISMSGVGCGTMVVSLICNYVNIEYGVKGYFVAISLSVLRSPTVLLAGGGGLPVCSKH